MIAALRDAGQRRILAPAWARRDGLLRYALPAFLAAVMPLTWYRPGRYFATGDVGPFVRDGLAAELGSVWGHQVSGAGGPSYEVARLPDLVLIKLCGVVGLGGPAAQLLLYSLILGAAAAGTSYLASVWLRRPGAAAFAGLLSVANAYVLVSLLNPLPALAGAAAALLGGQLCRAAQGHRVRATTFALSTLPLCYLAANPPLLAIVALATAGFALASPWLTGGRLRPVLVLAARALPLVLCLQLWWLVPQLITLQSGGGASAFNAQTNVQAWAWTQTRNTLGNILALNANWGWKYPEYYPFATAMDRTPWALLRWAPPLLAIAGALAPPGPPPVRRALRRLAAAGAVLVLLCKGLHPPLAGLNAWLYAQVPGMWLFREPMSKFGVLLVLVTSVLAGAALERTLEARRRSRHAAGAVSALRALPCALALAALVYPWPLWTGAVVDQARMSLPSASVEIPHAWQRIADQVNRSPATGKILELPLQGYYQVRTDWGYHGADTIPRQLLRRPVLQRLPGGYFDASPQLASLMALAESSLVDGDRDTAQGALRALGVDQVIVRQDLVSSPGDQPTADPARLRAGLARIPGSRLVSAGPVARVFQLPDGPAQPASLTLDDPADATTAAGAAARGAATVTDPRIPVADARIVLAGPGSHPFTLQDPGSYTVQPDRSTGVGYRMTEDPAGQTGQAGHAGSGSAAVRLTPVPRLFLDGAPVDALASLPIPPAPDPGPPAALLVDDAVLPWQAGAPVTLRPGDRVASATALGGDLMADPAEQSTGGCGSAAGGDRVRRLAGTSWNVAAQHGTACVRLPLRATAADGLLSLSLRYRTLSGSGPRVCLWQPDPGHCLVTRQLPAAPQWQTWTAVVRVPAATAPPALYGYTDAAPTGAGSAVEFADPHALGLSPGATVTVPEAAPPTAPWQATAGAHRLEDRQPAAPATAPEFGPLQDCARRDGRDFRAAGLLARPLGHDGMHLEARAHAACVQTPAGPTAPAAGGRLQTYRLHLRYRTTEGSPARICLWQQGPGSCALLAPLADSRQWTTLDTQVTVDPGTTEVALYLYADGQDAGTTRVDYDQVGIAPVAPALTVRIAPAQPAAAHPADLPRQPTAGSSRFAVRAVPGHALLALADSFDTRWRLAGLPAGWTARPVEIDGFRQAWLVTGHGDADLDAQFAPEGWWHAALLLSLLASLAAFLPLRRLRSLPAPLGLLTLQRKTSIAPRPATVVPQQAEPSFTLPGEPVAPDAALAPDPDDQRAAPQAAADLSRRTHP
ncbi:hypothetical protein ABUW04_04085 [Streptacidiphilus sp. N1-10]|uniref:DUF3367 domain-containing protein n=1 Tax=Streptacidiphilus jeojiensis TaxID=3229225 RepID=A0ABV6XGN7_9ACTN